MLKKVVCLILCLVTMCGAFVSCGGGTSIVGEWYSKDDKCLSIRDDGTWKLDGLYGTGTWKKLDKTTYELTDFYGSPEEIVVEKDDYGKYIHLFGRDFYEDEYPSQDEKNAEKNDGLDNDKNDGNSTSAAASKKTKLDPFKNVSFTVSGISPYCQIAVDSSECSLDVQKNVNYKFDKSYYANGEKAKVTASLGWGANSDYELSSTSYTYTVSNQPAYITSVSGVSRTKLENELNDYIEAEAAKGIGYTYTFGIFCNGCQSVSTPKKEAVYFVSVKETKKYENVDFYNSLNYIYSCTATDKYGETKQIYLNISAYNIVKDSDGTIKWGKKNPDSYDFYYESGENGVSNLVSTTITVLKDDYNISKVS